MKKIILTKPVTVVGPNVWGRTAKITFTPTEKAGWYLQNNKGELVPIDHRIAYCQKNTLMIASGGTAIKVCEHFLPLRYLGIDGIIVSVPAGQIWSPYLTAGEYYQHLPADDLEPTNEEIPSVEVKNNYHWSYPKTRPGSVSIKATRSGELFLNINAKWPGLPEYSGKVALNGNSSDFLKKEVFPSKPQGYPNWLYPIAKMLSVVGWPNLNKVAWLKDFASLQEASRFFWLHRVQDLLGDLSLASHVALLTANVISVNGGHEADLIVVKKSF